MSFSSFFDRDRESATLGHRPQSAVEPLAPPGLCAGEHWEELSHKQESLQLEADFPILSD